MLHIITDSMSDVTQVQGHKWGVQIIPLAVQIENETYLDGVTIDAEEFYEKMKAAKTLPKTSQVPPESFRKSFKKALESEADEVLCITGSSALSGTYQSAMIAKKEQEAAAQGRVFVVDSLSATLGGAILIRTAVKWRDEGLDGKTIRDNLNELKSRIDIAATVGDLKYLVMGGRLPKIGAKVGGLLNLKPMICVVEGAVKMAGVCRGMKKVNEWIVESMEKGGIDESYPVILGHADGLKSMTAFKECLDREKLLKNEPLVMNIGSIIGSHTGPGTFGIAWVKKG